MSAFAMFLPMIVVPVVSLMTEAPPASLWRGLSMTAGNTGTFDEKNIRKPLTVRLEKVQQCVKRRIWQ